MLIRNLLFTSLVITSIYTPSLVADEHQQATPSTTAAFSGTETENIFGDDDAFADVNIDLNCAPQQLPMWKRAGAWLFIKMYGPLKRVMLWWDKRSSSKKRTAHGNG